LLIRNSATHYGLIGRVMHWSSAGLLVTLILISGEFEDLAEGPERAALVREHASWGLVMLLLMSARLGWRSSNPNPVDSYTIRIWQRLAAYGVHRTIYIVIIGQCLIGIFYLAAADRPLPLFDFGELSLPFGRRETLAEIFKNVHAAISLAIYPLFAIHISAAIYHQLFGVRDEPEPLGQR
jgi:cytochrome b561